MKRLFAMLAVISTALSFCAVASRDDGAANALGTNLRVGVVLVMDESDGGYSYNHMLGLNSAAKSLGIPIENITVRRNVRDGAASEDVFRALAERGCNIIFSTSYGYEPYMVAVAAEYPEEQFCQATGYLAAESGLPNAHDYFPRINQGRYLTGVVAGMKAKEMNNPRLGFVAAHPNPEVISGYTSFYLGAKSVYPDVTMDVIYTNSWGDVELEDEAAQRLIDLGCGVLSQHSDTNAPALACERAGVFSAGYNSDMIADAPTAALVSARIDWGVYYEYALAQAMNGLPIAADWSGGIELGAVYLSPLNKDQCAKGTDAAVERAALLLNDGMSLFKGPLVGVNANGDILDLKEGESFNEIAGRSAPTFDYVVEGVTIQR